MTTIAYAVIWVKHQILDNDAVIGVYASAPLAKEALLDAEKHHRDHSYIIQPVFLED